MKLKHWLIAVSAAGTLAAAPVMAEMGAGAGAGAGGQDYPGAQEQGGMGGQDHMGAESPMGGQDGMMGQDQMGAESPMGGQDGMMGQDQQAGVDQEIVRSVQEKLSEQGKDLTVDGIHGPETEQALQEFQESEGLQATGDINEETLQALGMEEEAAEFAAAEEQRNGVGAQPEGGMSPPGAADDGAGAQPEGGMGGGAEGGMGGGGGQL